MATKKVKTTGTGGPGRYCTRAEAKEGARVRRRREDKERSGYVPGSGGDEDEAMEAYEAELAARAEEEEE